MQNFREGKTRESAVIFLPEYSDTTKSKSGLLLGFNVSEFMVVVLDIIEVESFEEYQNFAKLLRLSVVKDSFTRHFGREPKILGSLLDLSTSTATFKECEYIFFKQPDY